MLWRLKIQRLMNNHLKTTKKKKNNKKNEEHQMYYHIPGDNRIYIGIDPVKSHSLGEYHHRCGFKQRTKWISD